MHNFWVVGPTHAEGPLPEYFEAMVDYLATLNSAAAAAGSTPTVSIAPLSTPTTPLVERSLELSLRPGEGDGGRTGAYLIETVDPPDPLLAVSLWVCAESTGNGTVVVTPLVNTDSNGPFPEIDFVGAVSLRVSAYTAANGVQLGVSPLTKVYVDLRYTTLTHTIDAEVLENNWVRLSAVANDPTLGNASRSWTYSLFAPPATADVAPPKTRASVSGARFQSVGGSGGWTPTGLYHQNHSGVCHLQFGAPGVYFIGLVYSSNRFDLHATRAAPSIHDGLFAQPAPLVPHPTDGTPTFQPIAMVVPFANGTTPPLPSKSAFFGKVVTLRPTPGDVSLCLRHQSLSILTGPPGAGVIFLPLCPPPGHAGVAKALLLQLPKGVSVVPAPVGTGTQNVSQRADGVWVVQSANGGVLSEAVPVALMVDGPLAGTSAAAAVAVVNSLPRALNLGRLSSNTAWQNVTLVFVPWPNVTTTPRYLTTALTDAPASTLADLFVLTPGASLLEVYRRLGLSVFPTGSANEIDPRQGPGSPGNKHGRYYFPVNRSSPAWPAGLRYGVEFNMFGPGFNGPGFFCLGRGKSPCPVNASALPPGLSPAEQAVELQKWRNAVEFASRTGYVDIAYDGFLLQESFANLNLVTSLVQPEFVFSDAEAFPPREVYVATINASANAAARRRPNETACALAARIAAEFLASWVNATNNSTLLFYGDTPQGGHGAHGPWLAGDLAIYGERIVPQFGLYNAQAGYPIELFAEWIRLNKAAHQDRGLTQMVPWVTTGFDGPTTVAQTFAQAAHLFAGGCTGYSMFATASDGDWDSWGNMLAFSRATALVLPFEEIIALGSVAYDAVQAPSADTNVRAVSAVGYQGKYLLALSAVDGAVPMRVTVALPVVATVRLCPVISPCPAPTRIHVDLSNFLLTLSCPDCNIVFCP